ncbi:LCI fold-containing protein [Photorhabdus aegyptia]|uniref:Antimicrobial protein n=1 Tax=Photorhabdus aegyptia TaxID=2805098 RepID=A0A022PE24_9GAMM|nr:LCI fold-containing protein [Photorhabdus aegyptia]EYU14407.1 antimicrobial protein [Photorhabdus aegyptia]
MFKKLLTVGALATVLIGGVGTASAIGDCPSRDVRVSRDDSGWKYSTHFRNPYDNFANVFERDYNGKTIKWYFKSRYGACYEGDRVVFAAYYEGREK